MKNLSLAAVLVILVALATACAAPAPAPAPKEPATSAQPAKQAEPAKAAPEQGEPYVVGSYQALTGANSALGIAIRDGILIAEQQVNARGGVKGPDGKMHPMKVIVYDDGTDESKAVLAVKRLIEDDKTLAIAGGAGSGLSLAAIPVVEKEGVPLVTFGSAAAIVDPVKKWVFKTSHRTDQYVEAIFNFLKKKGLTKIALLHDSAAYGASGREMLEKMAPQAGITLVARESFAPTDVDMTAQLTRIKGSDAQALILWTTGPGVVVARNYQQLGMTIPFIDGGGFATSVKLVSEAGPAANGILVAVAKMNVADQLEANDPQKQILDAFGKDFKARFNREPDTFAAMGYDGALLIAHALEKAGPDKTKLRDAIENTKNFPATMGVFNMSPTDHVGLALDSLVMTRLKDGKYVIEK